MIKKWIVQEPPPESFTLEHPELPPLAASLLWNRGFRATEQINTFLNPDYQNLHDPFLFNDMTKAVAIINDCLEKKERIFVHGDYDADGVCAASIITNTLKKLGATNPGVFLPNRETDGYGLNLNTVQYLKDQGASLVITCDCGISNVTEVTLAKKLGLKVIITDHHTVPAQKPPADAIIHPLVPGEKYPDKTLSGGGVAFKLIQAILKDHHTRHELLPDGERHEAFEKWLLDLASISTVGDMVPLVGESRTIVRYGMTVLNKTRNLGLRHLLTAAGLFENEKPKHVLDTETVGYVIAPRINAAGRMDHANTAFALLTATTNEEAEALANKLQKNNTDRQKITEELLLLSREQIKTTEQNKNPIIFAYGESWSAGILGLIASKLKDEFYKPTIVMAESNGLIVGSGRSVPGFSLIGALQSMPEFFEKFGGHPMACGFSLKKTTNLEEFKAALLKKGIDGTKNIDLTPQIKIDAEVDLEEVNWKLFDLLQKFEPFGVGNEEPTYSATGLTIMSVAPVGKDNKHLRLLVKHNSHLTKKTIAFGFGDPVRHPSNWSANLKPGDKIDLAFNVSVNEWNGNRELQLMIVDIKKQQVPTVILSRSEESLAHSPLS